MTSREYVETVIVSDIKNKNMTRVLSIDAMCVLGNTFSTKIS